MRHYSVGDKNDIVPVVDKNQKNDKIPQMPNSVSFKRDVCPPTMKSIGIYAMAFE